ncbi:MFS transporter [Flavobacterium sp. DG1-102-2]|uniref:MFS transporter n=1 Tax=Flavobacterium sp. DG1-102-2 TaxID=3081663 RepID=UPI00294A5152|nr:MFS transporter [Flavobacterium sp. DG1-102-2]MDV6167497.1 MFS transporter [Flavobacterium sp. DG1-102-2]
MQDTPITKTQLAVMSAAAGICVANIYYNQPILKAIAHDFGVQESRAGIISVLAQAGYGLGLFFITPLGDKINRKKLILSLQVVLILTLVGITFVQNFFWICAFSLLLGLLSVAAQVILPLAASMDSKNRGRNVGIIFTGILVGILAARVFSGLIADWLNWRYVYGISSGMVTLGAIALYFTLPNNHQVMFEGNYIKLLGSSLQQLKRFPLLRRTALLGGLAFGIFCSFWTTLTFHLSGEPFNYKSDIIGLFGLLAIGGALLAPIFGKLADKGSPARAQVFSILLVLAGVLLVMVFPLSVTAFVAAVLLLDVGVQATQVTNVATIYSLDATAHSRINTAYMTSYFIGGALGTFVGIQCWDAGGWGLVTWQMLVWCLACLALAAWGLRRKA